MTDNRRTGAGFALTPFLPLVLIVLMLGAAVLVPDLHAKREGRDL